MTKLEMIAEVLKLKNKSRFNIRTSYSRKDDIYSFVIFKDTYYYIKYITTIKNDLNIYKHREFDNILDVKVEFIRDILDKQIIYFKIQND